MINIYDSMYDSDLNRIKNRIKLFIKSTDENGCIEGFDHGIAVVPEENGTMFIVDEWLIHQLDKIRFKDGTLSVKDGEELIPPVKSEKELKIEELQRQMAELRAMPDEPTDAERQTDAPLLDYTDKPTE